MHDGYVLGSTFILHRKLQKEITSEVFQKHLLPIYTIGRLLIFFRQIRNSWIKLLDPSALKRDEQFRDVMHSHRVHAIQSRRDNSSTNSDVEQFLNSSDQE
jgi:hypothetical protein